ncbi:hypothetical protein E0Z10_g1201 [Xylaria hypoxylon]|uniref:Carrier domain-containing protein n=1 Tax=Xylaria hypoxylon TaxID=37992 RepID=A0A4Z0ZD59_9PEZI|nr:hypothetical protein E0Z10_g1201 [Xylaria hypoxylon]
MVDFGRRLLPQVVDSYAQTDPDRVYASIPKSANDLSDGFRDVTIRKLAAVVNRLSWWLKDTIGTGNLDTIGYIGPSDIRYAAIFLAAVKCRYKKECFKVLFISPRNQVAQNEDMVLRSGCCALLYGEEMAVVIETLRHGRLQTITMNPMPSLDELMQTPENVDIYQYERTFDEARDEPCLILHSSGSTGEPKLVTMTHGTFACTDNDRNMPVPEGRVPQNAAQFDFEGGAGVHAYIDLPIFYDRATVVFGPSNLPPSGYLLSEILKHQPVRAFYVPPSIIEEWASEPIATEQVKQLDFVLFGGGPLSLNIGQRLSEVTNVCQMYGSLELGQVQLLLPQPGEWLYMEFNPFEEVDMQSCGDGSFEMVLHQDSKFSLRRSLWHNFPNVKEWRTGDLFVPHSLKPGLWRFHGRLDDLIVLSSSHKLRPLEMETLIQGDPLLSGALVVGQGKPEPLLIIEPKTGAYPNNSNPKAFIDRVWNTIVEANKIAPSYAKISRSRIILADPERPFSRAPKGTVVRKLTTKAYADDIDAAFRDDNVNRAEVCEITTMEHIDCFILPGLKKFVRAHVAEHLQSLQIMDTDNIFLHGLDSLGAASLSRSLQRGVANRIRPLNGSNSNGISLRLIHKNPTIERLAVIILEILTNGEVSEYANSYGVRSMEHAVTRLTKDLAPKKAAIYVATPNVSVSTINVALIGPRGSLGPNIVRELLDESRVGEIYCLNRGNDGKERMRSAFRDLNLPHSVDDERLLFMPIDLGKPHLGLSSAHLEKLLSRVNVIIHNAWRVDFSWSLDLFEEHYLQSVREIINLSSLSPLRPRVAFVSSVSSVQEWAAVFSDSPVDEMPLESYEVSSPLGYGQSKHVAERTLAMASAVCGTPVTILRLGQVAGPTDSSRLGGKWSTDEWIPSLAAISKVLQLIPDNIPPIDWVPVDLASRAIVELALAGCDIEDICNERPPLKVFNVVNPKLSQWSAFVGAMQRRLTVDGAETRGCVQVPLSEWVDALIRADPSTMPDAVARSSTKILPFFQLLVETAARGIALHPKFDTRNAVESSETMQGMGKVDEELIYRWLEQWGI